MEIQFFPPTETPEIIPDNDGSNSVDVLIYFENANEHDIGFFNYRTEKWILISGNHTKLYLFKKWKWRYFIDAIDKPKK